MNMKIVGKCESFGCRRLGLFIRRRWYDFGGEKMLGKTRTCRTCDKAIKKLLNSYNTKK